MQDFKIEIIGKRHDDGTGTLAWKHNSDNGYIYGDYESLDDFDHDYSEAVKTMTVQAVRTLESLYW